MHDLKVFTKITWPESVKRIFNSFHHNTVFLWFFSLHHEPVNGMWIDLSYWYSILARVRLCNPVKLRPIQASLWFTVDLRTWPCWKPPSRASRVSSKTASPLCRRRGTDASAPRSTAGGATTRSGTSTLRMHGIAWTRRVSVQNNIGGLKFCLHRNCVKATIVEKFAGPYDRGEYSPSVQKTLYDSQVLILQRIPEVRLHFQAKENNKNEPLSKMNKRSISEGGGNRDRHAKPALRHDRHDKNGHRQQKRSAFCCWQSFGKCWFKTCFTHVFALADSSSTWQSLRQHHWNTAQEATGQAVNKTFLWPL